MDLHLRCCTACFREASGGHEANSMSTWSMNHLVSATSVLSQAPRGQGYQHGHLAEGFGCFAPLCLVGIDESFQTGPITEHLQLTIPCWDHLQGSQVVSEFQGQGQGYRSGYRESATIKSASRGKDWGGGPRQTLGSFRKGEMVCAWRNPGGLLGGGRLELHQEGREGLRSGGS